MRKIAIIVGAVALALTATGCSTVSPEPDQTGLQYSGGALRSKNFKECIEPSKRDNGWPGDGYYVYPAPGSQRDFTADSSKPDREAESITVNTSDGQEVAVPVTVTFSLNGDCSTLELDGTTYKGGMLQLFHERHGLKSRAFWNVDVEGEARSDGAPPGWVSLLLFGIGEPLDRLADNLARDYTYRELWFNPAERAEFQAKLNAELGNRIDARLGAPKDKHFLEDIVVLVGSPKPTNKALLDAVAAEQAAIAQGKSDEAKAEAARKVALAEVAVAEARAQALRAELNALGPDVWAKKYAIDHQINPFPSPIVAGVAGAAAVK